MPTITALALESLLEPNTRASSSPPPPPITNNNNISPNSNSSHQARKPYYISPALYATPHPSSIPDSSPTSISPSPYIVNHKGRHLRLNGFGMSAQTGADRTDEGCLAGTPLVEEAGGAEEEIGLDAEWNEGNLVDEGSEMGMGVSGCENDDFFDPRESVSVTSNSEAEDTDFLSRNGSQNRSSLANQSEFYDVAEDFLSDCSISLSSPSFSTSNQIELHNLRLNILEEIEKRKRAEETLLRMQNQWQTMAKCMCQMGLSFPEIQHSGIGQIQTDPVTLCQEIVVARYVSEAVERGLARAETESALEEVIELKNHEISRLRDRLQYYEAMNREMSQRNQEGVELARQQRMRRNRRRRWVWSCIGLSISIGASLLIGYSYWPHPGTNPSPNSCPDDASSSSSSSAAALESGESE